MSTATYADTWGRQVCADHEKVCLSQHDAEYKAEQIRIGKARGGFGIPDPTMNAYAAKCGFWHLGHRSKTQAQRIAYAYARAENTIARTARNTIS